MGKESPISELTKNSLAIGPADIFWQTITVGNNRYEAIIKRGREGSNLYRNEVRGARMLNPYLPVVHPLGFFGPDKAIYPKINAMSLHELVLKFQNNSWDKLQQYLNLHLNLWQRTFSGNYNEPRSGYGNKITPTQESLLNFLKKFREFEFCKPMTIIINNGEFEIPSVVDSLDWLEKTILQAHKIGVCLTHGDENLGNCLVRKNGKLLMIDLGDAGFRSPFESMAKATTWLSATGFIPQSYLYRTTGVSQPLFQVTDKIDLWIVELEDKAQQYLQEHTGFLQLLPEKFEEYLKAFKMMYLLREALFYCHKRGRGEASYSLIAKALSLSAPYLR